MKKVLKKAFLLLELMTALFILATSGSAITRFFYQEIKLTEALSEYQDLARIMHQKINEISLDVLMNPSRYIIEPEQSELSFSDSLAGYAEYTCDYQILKSDIEETIVCEIQVRHIMSKRLVMSSFLLPGIDLKKDTKDIET